MQLVSPPVVSARILELQLLLLVKSGFQVLKTSIYYAYSNFENTGIIVAVWDYTRLDPTGFFNNSRALIPSDFRCRFGIHMNFHNNKFAILLRNYFGFINKGWSLAFITS